MLKRISSSEATDKEKGTEGDGKKEKGADKGREMIVMMIMIVMMRRRRRRRMMMMMNMLLLGAIKTTDTFAFNEQFRYTTVVILIYTSNTSSI